MSDNYVNPAGVAAMKAWFNTELQKRDTEIANLRNLILGEEIAYVSSQGGSWIDTGVPLNGALTFYMKTRVPSGRICASMVAHNTNTQSENGRIGFMTFNTSSHKVDYFWCGVQYATLDINSNIDLGEWFEVLQDKNGITVTQGEYYSHASYSGTEATNTSSVQLLHSQNSSHSSYMWGDIAKCWIKNGDTFVRDFTPRNSQIYGVGLYDSATSRLYLSNGSPFIAGDVA